MKDTILKGIQRFFAKRAPRADLVALNLRNVYVFFSRSGLLFALLLGITFVTGVNYGNNLVLGLCFYLASIWVISFHFTFAHIAGLKLKLQQTQMVQVGEVSWVTLAVINDKSKPSRQIRLGFDHKLQLANMETERTTPQGVSASSTRYASRNTKNNQQSQAEVDAIWEQAGIADSQTLVSVLGTQRTQLPVMTYHRGKLTLPRLVISTVYPLGIMQAWSYVYFASPVWVYPKPKAFDLQAINVVDSDDEQELSAHTTVGQNDFELLDEFHEGESLARVSWAHLARGQGMLTKHFADPIGREQRLDYEDMPAAHHEEKLSQLAYAVIKLGETGGSFQMNLPNDKGDIGQGEAFVRSCLLRLAKCP